MKKSYKITIKVIVVIVLFYLIFDRFIDIDKFLLLIKDVDYYYLIIGFLLGFVGIFMSAYKWRLILQAYDIKINLKETFDLYRVGSFFNNFLPSSIGGDGYKFIYLNKRYPEKRAHILSSMILERGLGFVSLILLTLTFSPFFLYKINNTSVFYLIIFLIISIIGFFIFLVINKKPINLNFKNKIFQKIIKLINVLITFNNKKILFTGLFISLLFTFLCAISVYLYFLAFGNNIEIKLISFLYPIINLIGIIPISINSLGVTEGFSVYMYGIFGISAETALAVAIVARVIGMLTTSTGGIKYLLRKK